MIAGLVVSFKLLVVYVGGMVSINALRSSFFAVSSNRHGDKHDGISQQMSMPTMVSLLPMVKG